MFHKYFAVGNRNAPFRPRHTSICDSGLNYWLCVLRAGTCLVSSLLRKVHAHVFCCICGGATNRFKFSTSQQLHPQHANKKKCKKELCLHNRCKSQDHLLSHDWAPSCMWTPPCTNRRTHNRHTLTHICGWRVSDGVWVILKSVTPGSISTVNGSLEQNRLPSAAFRLLRTHSVDSKSSGNAGPVKAWLASLMTTWSTTARGVGWRERKVRKSVYWSRYNKSNIYTSLSEFPGSSLNTSGSCNRRVAS